MADMSDDASDRIEIAADTYDCHATDTSWRFRLYLDPEARRVSHYEQYGSGTPERAWKGRALLADLPFGAVGSAVREIVEGDEFRALVTALFGLYRGAEWDGSDHVGRWDGVTEYDSQVDVGVQAVEALFQAVPTYWAAGDWVSGGQWDESEADNVRKRMADGETLDDIANDMVADALGNDAHLDPEDMLRELEALLERYPVTCECSCCDCDEPATDTDEGGNPSCAACLTYLSLDDGTLVCSRQTEDFTRCHECYQDISWTGILTGTAGQSNYRLGDCACGKEVWRNEEAGGGWDRYGYTPIEDEAVG